MRKAPFFYDFFYDFFCDRDLWKQFGNKFPLILSVKILPA